MLLAFIDTNIFFNNWYLRSPNFGVLATYLANEGGTLLLSEVVRQEVEAKFKAERDKLQRSLAGDLRRAADFQHEPALLSIPDLEGDFNFAEVLARRFDDVRLVDVDSVSNGELVPRAIGGKRPFRENEKGFRDTLIWLSLIAHLKKLGRSDLRLLLITANSNDFFDKSQDTVALHPDLQHDLTAHGLSVAIVPYQSVKDLFGKEIDVGLHSFRHEEFKEENGDEMEDLASQAAESYLAELPLNDMQSMLEVAGLPKVLARAIRSFSVIDFEGSEDPEVTSFKSLKDGTIYVGYTFNLLTVVVTVVVDANDYYAHEREFESHGINSVVEGSSVSLDLLRRCDFEGGLSYRPDEQKFTSVTIDQASMWRNRKYR